MSKRPRGFIEEWSPKQSTIDLLACVRAVIDDTVPQVGPITLRQLFYMLVVRFEYDKTERAYQRLCEMMNRARRAQIVSMSDIRDDGLTRREWQGGYDTLYWQAHRSREAFVRALPKAAEAFRYQRQGGQDQHLIVWCEAQGMVPQLVNAVGNWGIEVISSGGFDSLSSKHRIAYEIANRYVPTVILHIGDRDPSGEHIHMSLFEDLEAFVDGMGGEPGYIDLERIAVTEDQIYELDLPTAPPKRTDNRSFSGLATQAEAIDPHDLRRIVRQAARWYIDIDVYESLLEREQVTRDELSKKLEGLS